MINSKTRIRVDSVAEPAEALWSNCLLVNGVAYISGLTARARDGETIDGNNAFEQAHTIFKKIKAYVDGAGGQMNDVVNMVIYVTNMSQNKEVWRARREYFTGDFPACALVEVSALAKPEILVEISAIAHIGCSSN